ncbi:hypothetical protein WA556_001613 [Blastocystis sp. ATCC 50177/Nand II]
MIGLSREQWNRNVMMDEYVPEQTVRRRAVCGEVEITTYQGDHSDEYMVKDLESGRCTLFHKGLLKMSWQEENGKKVGGFTLYDNGKAAKRWNWTCMWSMDVYRWIENCKNGLELVVKGNGVVYRGGFDDVDSMKREGRGMEFDEKSGRLLRCGVWKNDELFQITQEFESVEVMTEYAVEEGKENMSALNRHPVYRGGYVFDEKKYFLRNGYGCEIEGGVAVREGVWKRGELKECKELFDGWYVKREGSELFDWKERVEYLRMEIHNLTEGESVSSNVTELVIPSNCCNEEEWSVFDVSALKRLKSIEIGDDCFENVKEAKLIGMNQLERVVVGQNSFTVKNWTVVMPVHRFCLKRCGNMRELVIGRESFRNYSVCEIEEMPSLEVIEMGELGESSRNFVAASLELRNMHNLKSLLLGNDSFGSCVVVAFENLPELTSIQLGSRAFSFQKKNVSTLIMRNLPNLTSLTTITPSTTFRDVRQVTLDNIPALTNVLLDGKNAFMNKTTLSIKGNIGALMPYLNSFLSFTHKLLICNALSNESKTIPISFP